MLRLRAAGILALALLGAGGVRLLGADFDLEKARGQFLSGAYQAVVKEAREALEAGLRNEEWHWLRTSSLWATGEYEKAKEAVETGLRASYYSIRMRVLAHKVFRSAGDAENAARMLEEINSLGGSRRFGLRDPVEVVALGEAAVLLGADPKLVLDNFLGPIRKSNPELREVHLAIGRLALDKRDYALAGQAFQEGLKKHPKDPELLHGLAEALAPSDRKEMLGVIEKVFEANKHHVGSRLLLIEHLIDAEDYLEAESELEKITEVNPHQPEMWAYRALLAHLENDTEGEAKARAAGLEFWKTNPEVDHIIGRKLSQKYRFKEGAEYQRQALKFDGAHLPAKMQLAQDLLRLGIEQEGWERAEEVAKADAYHIGAFNLVTLHDTIRKFTVLTNEHFILKMAPAEAEVYGAAALELLETARERLTRKYGLELEQQVTVEIFPEQKDFAVRTFGMPGGEGYLGVCFGSVITANSPATHTMNWQSMLWHEFCHVVTLNLTRNRMPRWLSEGISVHEERLADARWGEQMNPQFREFITEGKMKPIAELSAAFMAPPSGLHMQFAYFQSSLVVDYLIENFGLEKMRAILRDLGAGKEINDALAANTAPLPELEKGFKEFARGAAQAMGSDSVWKKPERRDDGSLDPAWAAVHPENFWVTRERIEEFAEEGKEEEAIPLLEKSIKTYPRQSGAGCAYDVLAGIYRSRKETAKEREILSEWAKWDGEAVEALLRLIEIDSAAKEHRSAVRYATQMLEVNPLHPRPYRALAEAAEHAGNEAGAMDSYRTVLRLDPPDRPEIHYRLARLARKADAPGARRHVLLALEEAPRFRAALQLLLELEAAR